MFRIDLRINLLPLVDSNVNIQVTTLLPAIGGKERVVVAVAPELVTAGGVNHGAGASTTVP